MTPQVSTTERTTAPHSDRLLTLPNILCFIRLFASPGVGALAWLELPNWCFGLIVFLFLTDWLDGKLAIWLDQRTTFGARLDSLADVTFYGCVLVAILLVRGDLLWREVVWIGLAACSFAVSVAVALSKYRRVPSYHTRMAKTSWLLMFVAVTFAFLDRGESPGPLSVWTLRIAMLGVILTNVETTLITFLLPQWRADVPSIFHARRYRAEGEPPC